MRSSRRQSYHISCPYLVDEELHLYLLSELLHKLGEVVSVLRVKVEVDDLTKEVRPCRNRDRTGKLCGELLLKDLISILCLLLVEIKLLLKSSGEKTVKLTFFLAFDRISDIDTDILLSIFLIDIDYLLSRHQRKIGSDVFHFYMFTDKSIQEIE